MVSFFYFSLVPQYIQNLSVFFWVMLAPQLLHRYGLIASALTLYAKWEKITLLERIGGFFSDNWLWLVLGLVVALVLVGIVKRRRG